MHGHGLEGSGLLELIVTAQADPGGQAAGERRLPGADPACALDVIIGAPREAASPYALSLNAAFGGANTALLVRAA